MKLKKAWRLNVKIVNHQCSIEYKFTFSRKVTWAVRETWRCPYIISKINEASRGARGLCDLRQPRICVQNTSTRPMTLVMYDQNETWSYTPHPSDASLRVVQCVIRIAYYVSALHNGVGRSMGSDRSWYSWYREEHFGYTTPSPSIYCYSILSKEASAARDVSGGQFGMTSVTCRGVW